MFICWLGVLKLCYCIDKTKGMAGADGGGGGGIGGGGRSAGRRSSLESDPFRLCNTDARLASRATTRRLPLVVVPNRKTNHQGRSRNRCISKTSGVPC